MDKQLQSTKKLTGLKVVDARKGKRIGKVRRFVFHPNERRCIGFMVKRPDAALMFHRKDLFVALGGYELRDGQVVVSDAPDATDRGAVRALGVDWDACVIWIGMPVLTESGDFLGYASEVEFHADSGMVDSLVLENGAASDVLLGRRMIPGKLVKGFRRGQGVALVPAGEYRGEDVDESDKSVERGAILVSDTAADIAVEGGAAAVAGKATAVVANKAKTGAGKVKQAASEQARRAKPTVQKAAAKTEEAVNAGAFAAGKQLGKASGMFAAFKEEYQKAARGEDN